MHYVAFTSILASIEANVKHYIARQRAIV